MGGRKTEGKQPHERCFITIIPASLSPKDYAVYSSSSSTPAFQMPLHTAGDQTKLLDLKKVGVLSLAL